MAAWCAQGAKLPTLQSAIADLTVSPRTARCSIIRTAQSSRGISHEDRRRPPHRLFDAADQSGLPAGALPLLQPRILRHHLPHRSRALAAVVPEPLEVAEPVVQIRIHPHARFHRLRRLHRNRAGDPGALQGRGGRLCPRDVSRRRGADRRRPRALGFSQETREAEDRHRERRAGRHAALRLGALRLRHHGLQASRRRP